ncbi:thermonuclease family protein [Stutzerimonas stutzeri]|uniref:thermonuclease family protein n=1 Tax=Stutzerimonas stutzeri TaxID=316 RepID=UPI00265CB722|nr:thermonuclease family protein [Stutzerimonas stutzeri]MCF6783701.1 thermonuclease family protein [Stutzerimonas stutzeri]
MISKLLRIAVTPILLAVSLLTNASPLTMQAHLEGIADGDTIYVRDTANQVSYRVRLAMIDAPESKQEYGTQSKSALQQLLRGAGVVTLQVESTDRYGRLIAIVEDERKRNINLEMVNQGAAWVYTQYAQRGAFAGQYRAFAEAERSARLRQLGLWNNPNPVEPWRYRRQQ